jgi:hypothetical protein
VTKRKRSKWRTVHDALELIDRMTFATASHGSMVKDYQVTEHLNQRPAKVKLNRHTGFTMRKRNK